MNSRPTGIPVVQPEARDLLEKRERAIQQLRRRGVTDPRPLYFSVPRGPGRRQAAA